MAVREERRPGLDGWTWPWSRPRVRLDDALAHVATPPRSGTRTFVQPLLIILRLPIH